MDKQAHIYRVQAWSLLMILDDFTEEEWRLRPNGMGNALWILGHIIVDRKHLANMLGMDEEITERDERFEAGTKPEDVPAEVRGADLLQSYRELHGRFMEHLDGMTDEDLAAAVEPQFPETPQTRLGALQFLLMHEAYHVGQLGALRVMAGKGSWFARLQPPSE